MAKKIGVISPYPEFTKLVKSIAEQLDIPVAVKEGALTSGLYYANQLIKEHNVKAIVARGSTANFLKEKLDIPIVKINVTNFDLLKSFQQAREHAKRIVFIDHVRNGKLYDLSFIENLLEIEISLKQYTNEKDIASHIKELAGNKAAEIIVGTAQCLANTAFNKGIKSIVVNSSSEAVIDALKRAEEISYVYEEEKLRQKHLETIISYAFDGVIATDQSGKISVFNEMACKIIGVKQEDVIGRYLDHVQYPFIKKLVGDRSEVTENIVTMDRNKYVVNRIPIKNQEDSLVITFQEINKVVQLDSLLRSELYHRRFYAKYEFEDIVCESKIMKQTIDIAKKFSKSDSNVLITGESGTGKELFAQGIHNESSRKNGPFIAINCAALPMNLLESELFGYEEGAFTGAKKGGRPGLFEMAHGGTLFLDEIGELPIALQTRLLRVLQEKEVMRIGGDRIIPVDVRVISATNKDLKKGMKERDFRTDLYYRLNILQISLPPLRDRKEDIPHLVQRFFYKHKGEANLLDSKTLHLLTSHDWPGNVRELENVVERIVAMGNRFPLLREVLFQEDLTDKEGSAQKETIAVKVGTLQEMEQQIIQHFYHKSEGNRQTIANLLGISRTTLWKKIKEMEQSS